MHIHVCIIYAGYMCIMYIYLLRTYIYVYTCMCVYSYEECVCMCTYSDFHTFSAFQEVRCKDQIVEFLVFLLLQMTRFNS